MCTPFLSACISLFQYAGMLFTRLIFWSTSNIMSGMLYRWNPIIVVSLWMCRPSEGGGQQSRYETPGVAQR